MSVTVRIYIVILIIFTAALSSLYRYAKLDRAGKTIMVILVLQVINELLAYIFAKIFRNNMLVYNINNVLELSLIALYFNFILKGFGKNAVAIWIGIIGVIFGIINFTFLQKIDAFSVNYLLFEGFCVILLALIAFYYLLLNQDDLKLYRYPHFWLTSILLFFWSVTYVTWGIFPLIQSKENVQLVGMFIWLINVINYAAIALVFLFYPKMKITNE